MEDVEKVWMLGRYCSSLGTTAAHEVFIDTGLPYLSNSTPRRPINGRQVAGGVCTAAAKTANGEARSRRSSQTASESRRG
jgi:hypothetical protein